MLGVEMHNRIYQPTFHQTCLAFFTNTVYAHCSIETTLFPTFFSPDFSCLIHNRHVYVFECTIIYACSERKQVHAGSSLIKIKKKKSKTDRYEYTVKIQLID